MAVLGLPVDEPFEPLEPEEDELDDEPDEDESEEDDEPEEPESLVEPLEESLDVVLFSLVESEPFVLLDPLVFAFSRLSVR